MGGLTRCTTSATRMLPSALHRFLQLYRGQAYDATDHQALTGLCLKYGMIPHPTPMTGGREAYLRHCMRVSVTRRLHWSIGTLFVVFGLLLLLNLPIVLCVAGGAVVAGGVTGVVALTSFARHRTDFF